MDVLKMGLENEHFVYLNQDMFHCPAFVNMVMNLVRVA
jgi:hypothetical protein